MKKRLFLCTIIILSVIIAVGCDIDQRSQVLYQRVQAADHPSQPADVTPLPIVQDMIGQVNQQRILTDLRRMSGVEQICTQNGCYTITDRDTGSEGLAWVKDYFIEQLTNLGYSVQIQDWSMEGYADQNLIVRKVGRLYPQEEIFIVAHLDGVPQSPAADDNASGAVDLLELARILSHRTLSRTVVMLFSTGEEHGALGVHRYIDQLTPEQLSAIQYVVNVDMVGYDSDDDGAMQLWSGEQPLDFAQLLYDIIAAYQIDLVPRIVPGCT